MSNSSLQPPLSWEGFLTRLAAHPEEDPLLLLSSMPRLEGVLAEALRRDKTLFCDDPPSPLLAVWTEAAMEMARNRRIRRNGELWLLAQDVLADRSGDAEARRRTAAVAMMLSSHGSTSQADSKRWMMSASSNSVRAVFLLHPEAGENFWREQLRGDDGLVYAATRLPGALEQTDLRQALRQALAENAGGRGEHLRRQATMSLSVQGESHPGFAIYLEAAILMGKRGLGDGWVQGFFREFQSAITPAVATALLGGDVAEMRLDAIRRLGTLALEGSEPEGAEKEESPTAGRQQGSR